MHYEFNLVSTAAAASDLRADQDVAHPDKEGYPKLSLKKSSPIAARNDDLKVFNGRR
jgi:hypothetical protein